MFNGCFFLWANISVYVLSYVYKYDKTVNVDAIFYVDLALLALNVIGYQVGMYLLNDRGWGPKHIVAVGGFLALAGKWFASYTTSIWVFISLYGLLGGIGNGMSYMIPLVCTWEYFPKRKGLITGIIVSGYGLGSFIST